MKKFKNYPLLIEFVQYPYGTVEIILRGQNGQILYCGTSFDELQDFVMDDLFVESEKQPEKA